MDWNLLFSSYANVFLDPQVLLMTLLGAAGGILLGAIPGMTATMGVALLMGLLVCNLTLKPLVGRGGPRARAGLTPSCGHSRPCLQLWAGGCPPRQAPPWALLSSVSRLVPVLPPQTRGSLGLGLGASGGLWGLR